jgi:hypothetical protein
MLPFSGMSEFSFSNIGIGNWAKKVEQDLCRQITRKSLAFWAHLVAKGYKT